jgi:hypothetical protein
MREVLIARAMRNSKAVRWSVWSVRVVGAERVLELVVANAVVSL